MNTNQKTLLEIATERTQKPSVYIPELEWFAPRLMLPPPRKHTIPLATEICTGAILCFHCASKFPLCPSCGSIATGINHWSDLCEFCRPGNTVERWQSPMPVDWMTTFHRITQTSTPSDGTASVFTDERGTAGMNFAAFNEIVEMLK